MLPVVNWYRDVLGFTRYWDVEFHTSEVDGGRKLTGSGLRSIVMADPSSGIKFATNEPMRPFFRESQINRFCEDHHGAGVQHIAFLVKEIIPAVESLRERGVKFLTAPEAYYDRLPARLEAAKVSNVKEPMEALRRNHILVDGKDDRYMLQIFMLDAGAPLRRRGGGPVLLRGHPARGRQGVRLRELPGPLRVDRVGAAGRAELPRGRRLTMIDRMQLGEVPGKPHTAFRSPTGELRYEECFTRARLRRRVLDPLPRGPADDRPLDRSRRNPAPSTGRSADVRLPKTRSGAASSSARRRRQGGLPICGNTDVVVSLFELPSEASSETGFANGDGDDLLFVFSGRGHARDALRRPRRRGGRLRPRPAERRPPLADRGATLRNRVRAPRRASTSRRSTATPSASSGWTPRTPTATSGARVFRGPRPGPREVLVKKGDRFVRRVPLASPFDVVGWDGTVWPFAFPILAFQPKTGLVHLPPTIHATFAARGALVCSFVPRVTDFHPEAIPCPYPHSSVDCDELIYYVRGSFTSRRGVGPKAVSLHPAGIPHGPHPGRLRRPPSGRGRPTSSRSWSTRSSRSASREQALALELPGLPRLVGSGRPP